MARTVIRNIRLVDASGERAGSEVAIEGTRIAYVGPVSAEGMVIDAGDAIVTPGFIDVHTHGGGGFDLHTTDPRQVLSYARWAPSSGTTAFLAGVVGVPGRLPEEELGAVARAAEQAPAGGAAEILGVHTEGPFINVKRRGAHDPSWLRLPDEGETERVLEAAGGYLRLVTLAPELPRAEAMVRRLVEAGVTVSMGHTDMTYEQAAEAIELGVTHTTHCFNAMPPLLHRAPGPLGALVEAEGVQGEIIADGMHVHPAVVRFLVGALGPERVVVVTDALAVAGLGEGLTFTFGGQEAHVADGICKLADGSLTGSVLTMDQALRNMVEFTGLPLHHVVGMLTLNPARAARADDRKGLLRSGYDADLLVFDNALRLLATYCRGRLAYATEEWHDKIASASSSNQGGGPL
jgi:N-acetylglucosamine-6-phosphate deacetylase